MNIDWARIRELFSEIGAEDFDEIVGVFLGEVDETIRRLDPDAAPETLEADMHFLKSSALNLGFSALAEVCLSGERRAAGGARPTEEVARVAAVFGACSSEFAAGRAALAAPA